MRAAWDAVVVSVVIVAVALIVAVVAVASAVCWLASLLFRRSSRDDFALWERQFDSGVHQVNPGTWGLAESVDPVRDIGDGVQ